MKIYPHLLAKHSKAVLRFYVVSMAISQLLIISAAQMTAQETAGSAPTLAGPVAAYSFDEGMGANVTDASGHGNNGIVNGATWTSQAQFGNALSFTAPNWVT